MAQEVESMRETLINLLKEHLGPLKITADTDEKFEVAGTIPAMQGKKKVDGFYFSSVVPKPKDVRLYFFPVYTHKDEVGELPPTLQKSLKGKSCFHFKKIDDEIEEQLRQMIQKSVEIYQAHGLLDK